MKFILSFLEKHCLQDTMYEDPMYEDPKRVKKL